MSEDVPAETMAAQAPDSSQVPVPDVSPEEEALLFGQAGQTTTRPQPFGNFCLSAGFTRRQSGRGDLAHSQRLKAVHMELEQKGTSKAFANLDIAS